MFRSSLLIAVACTLVLAPGPSAALLASPSRPGYQIIVHPDGPAVSGLDARFVADVFLKKVRNWPNGEPIRPVDLEPSSQVRQRFSEEVIHRPVAAVRAYWQQRLFSGRDIPPPEMGSDEAVINFVMKHVGAIGYVSSGTTSPGPRIVAVR
jgi:ABC-type phosphate transport system substrate-binding protein